jgi:UDP-glucose 4-epimerase
VPAALIGQAARLFGRGEIYERLAGSLVASPAALTGLGWLPPVATRVGLADLARISTAEPVPTPA